MATKIQQILEAAPNESVLFGSWLSSQGLDARGQYAYMKSGWLDRISKGVYKIHGTEPSLYAAVSSYNTQLSKSCVVGAYTALELRGYSHYLSMGKPKAYLFTDKSNKLPLWLLKEEWDMTIKYMTTSFLGDELLGVETMTINQHDLLVSSPERAILECLNLPDASSSLLDIYYIMEGLRCLFFFARYLLYHGGFDYITSQVGSDVTRGMHITESETIVPLYGRKSRSRLV